MTDGALSRIDALEEDLRSEPGSLGLRKALLSEYVRAGLMNDLPDE